MSSIFKVVSREPTTCKFEVVEDGDCQFVLAQKELIESDHPVFIFIVLLYMEEYIGEEEAKDAPFHCSIQAVSPKFAGDDNLQKAKDSWGVDDKMFDSLSDLDKANLLREYGCTATIWQESGKNKATLLREAKTQLTGVNVMFGFYMDPPQNMIGDTGWDFIQGNLGGALQRERI